jgi:hypothetical protein
MTCQVAVATKKTGTGMTYNLETCQMVVVFANKGRNDIHTDGGEGGLNCQIVVVATKRGQGQQHTSWKWREGDVSDLGCDD